MPHRPPIASSSNQANGSETGSRRSGDRAKRAAVNRPQPDLIGIGAAVTRRPLPHHRAYGSVHGDSSGYASILRITKEVRAT